MITPPKLATRLLNGFLRGDLSEEVRGDLEENFFSDLKNKSAFKAKLNYWYQVLNYLRPFAIRKLRSHYLTNHGMLKNYFKIGWRNLRKEKSFSFINIFGLAVGMAAFLLIIHYVRFERSYEDFNPNADKIYRITLDLYKGSEYVVTDCETHPQMGPLLKARMPEVKDFVRMYNNEGLKEIRVRTQVFLDDEIYFADPSIFNLLSLHVLHGEPASALTEPMQVVLTETLAKKYFGRTDIVGEAMEVRKKLYHITAVIADIPRNTHLKFKMLLSHSTLAKEYGYEEDSWNGNNEYTYLLMTPETDLASFNKKLSAFCVTLKDKLDNNKYVAEPIKNIHLYSNKTYEPEANGNAKVVFFLLIIAAFVILIAWINYINLSTARAVERAKEVGIRKVMGSIKSQLVFQFLSESIIVNLLASLLTLGLFRTLLPIFRNLTGSPLSLNFTTDSMFWYLFIGLLLVGSLLSGIYPAFVLASFQPAAVLKGKFRSSSHGQILRKGLVIFQFGTTVVLLIGMLTVYLQINHMRQSDLGMNIDQTLVIRAPRLQVSDSLYNSSFQSLATELYRRAEVKKISRSGALPGLSLNELSSTRIVKLGEDAKKSYEYYYFGIDAEFILAMDMKLAAGRNFESGVPNNDEVVINEEAARKLGFSKSDDAIGAKITFQTRWPGEPATVIGVIKNFYQRSPKEKHIPMLFQYENRTNYFSVKLDSENIHETIEAIKTTYDQLFPNTVFSYFFLNEKFNQQYQADAQFGQVIGVFSGLAVFIACLGLFGLSSYTILQRTKEIGIRKVMGASVVQIMNLLAKDFAKVIIIAALIALPVAYFSMNEWLSGYEIRISLNAWIFVVPVIVILLLALITVSFQTIKTAMENPVNSLKSE